MRNMIDAILLTCLLMGFGLATIFFLGQLWADVIEVLGGG